MATGGTESRGVLEHGLRLPGWATGALVGLLLAVGVLLGEVGELLGTLHTADTLGGSIGQALDAGIGSGAEAARTTIEAWRAVDGLAGIPSPFAIARLWLIVDFGFLILYTLVVLTTTRPGGALGLSGEMARPLRFGRLGVLLLALLDIVENSIAWFVVRSASRGGEIGDTWLVVLSAVRVVKLLVGASVVALLILAAWRKLQLLRDAPSVRQGLVMARTQIMALGLFILAVMLPIQTSDVFLDLGARQTWLVTLQLLLFCLALGLGARNLIEADLYDPGNRTEESLTSDPSRRGGQLSLLLVIGLAGLALLSDWKGLYGLAIVLLVVLILSFLTKGATTPPPATVPTSTRRLPTFLGIAPLVVFGVGLIRWTAWADLLLGTRVTLGTKTLIGLVVVVAASALMPLVWSNVIADGIVAGWGRRVAPGAEAFIPGLVWVIAAAPVVVMVVADARRLGPLGLLIGGASAVNAVGMAAVRAADQLQDRAGLPSVFRLLNLKRIPVFVLVAAWLAVNLIPGIRAPDYNDVTPGIERGEERNLLHAYSDWFASRPAGAAAIPLVIVAAEGGGIRAAYWTEQVLDELFPPDGVTPFLLSGASGGSVGIATHLSEEGLSAVEDLDLLSPILQRWFGRDIFHAFLRNGAPNADRAERFERSLEEAVPALAQTLGYDGAPIPIYNTASAVDSCIGVFTPLADLATAHGAEGRGCLDPDRLASESEAGIPGAFDPVPRSCPTTNHPFVSTAVVTSARFPFVTPAGRYPNCQAPPDHWFFVDAGYVDNTGAGSALAAYSRIAGAVADNNADPNNPCVIPFFIQIDNGAESITARLDEGDDPIQPLIPLQAILGSSNSSRDTRLKVQAAGVFSAPLIDANGITVPVTLKGEPLGSRYFRVFPLASPGRDASLGWLLSDPSRALLDSQRSAALAAVSEVLSESADLACVRPAADGAGN